jgi:hypothetical protein
MKPMAIWQKITGAIFTPHKEILQNTRIANTESSGNMNFFLQ